jgi:hypothetical protein
VYVNTPIITGSDAGELVRFKVTALPFDGTPRKKTVDYKKISLEKRPT